MYEDLDTLEMEGLEELGFEGLDDYEFEGLDYEELGEFGNWEDEYMGEYEFADDEGDPFLGSILKKLARTAAGTVGRAVAGRTGGQIANMITSRVFREGEFGEEYESEAEFEAELEAEGGDLELFDKMAYYAELAAETESEAEAAEFIGALANLAGPLISSLLGQSESEYEGYEYFEDEADPFFGALIPVVTSLAGPLIKRGIGALGRLFRRRKRRRRGRSREAEAAIKAIPQIVAKTVTALKRQAKTGKPITRKQIAAVMAQKTAKALATRRALAKAVKCNRVAARRAHRMGRRALLRRPHPRVRRVRPVGRPV